MEQTKNKDSPISQRSKFITIEYRTFMGKGDKLTLQNSTPIQQLSNIIGQNLGEKPENLELYNLGRFLKCREKTLLQYGVKNNSIVHVSVVFEEFKKMHHQLIQKRLRNSSFITSLSPKYASLIIKIADTKINLMLPIVQSVQALKDKIQKISSFESKNILLFYDEKQLKLHSTLEQCGITNFAVLRGQLISQTINGDSRQLNIDYHTFQKKLSALSGSEINIFDKSNIQSQEDDQIYYFMRDSLKQDQQDAKDFIQNIKLSESVDVFSSNADVEIPYIYDGIDSKGRQKQIKTFQSLHSFDYQKSNFLTVSQTNVNTRKKSIQIRQQKWIGPCQINLQNQARTISATVFVNNSEYKFEEIQNFMQNKLGIKSIKFLHSNTSKHLLKDLHLYAVPWQSTILNGVLRINIVYSTTQDEN